MTDQAPKEGRMSNVTYEARQRALESALAPAVTDHLDAIKRDLALVVDGARWAHGMGYEKPGRGLDAERGVVHRIPTPEEAYEREANPDFIAGPVDDLAFADHRARLAYRAAVRAVGTCAVYLEAIVNAEGLTPSQPCPELNPYSPPSQLVAAARHAEVCANHIKHPERHIRRLKDLRTRLDSAVRGLSPVLDEGSADGIAHKQDPQPDRGIPVEKRCVICKRRAKGKKTGDRCQTCHQYRKRNNGRERPTHMDSMTPQEAQRKRLERGESYGAA